MKDLIVLTADKNTEFLLRGLLPRIPEIERINPFSFDIFPHIHNQAVETTLVRNHAVQGVVEQGIPLKYLIDPFSPECVIRFIDDPFQHRDLFVGDPLADDLEGVPFQNRPEFK